MFRWFLILIIFLCASPIFARTWTIKGKTIKADYVRVENNNIILKRRGRTAEVPVYEIGYKDLEFLTSKYARYLRNKGNYAISEADTKAREAISKVIFNTLRDEGICLETGTETCNSVRSPGPPQCSTFYRDMYRPALDYYDLYRPEGLVEVKPADIEWVRERYNKGIHLLQSSQ